MPHAFGGRGWWDLDSAGRPAWAWEAELLNRYQPNAEVAFARPAVLDLIGQFKSRYEPDFLAVVGFSQGAMLALDVGLADGSGVDRVAALSGVLLADSLPALLNPAATRPRFLLVHGEQDDEVPFAGGETARDLLQRRGLSVQWLSFAGGHDIPGEAALAVRTFLTTDLDQ